MTTTKLSFSDSIKNLDAKKNNSDLENLATAVMNINMERQNIAKFLEGLKVLEQQIFTLAGRIEAGELVDVGEVSALYRQAQHFNSKRL